MNLFAAMDSNIFFAAGLGALRLGLIAALFAAPMVLGAVLDDTPAKQSKNVGFVLMVSLQRAG